MTMKTALAAVAMAVASLGAQASTSAPAVVTGSFNQALSTVDVLGLSNLTGTIDYLVSAVGASGTSYTASPIANLTTSLYKGGALQSTATGSTFSFNNLGSGTYSLWASGQVLGGGFNLVIAQYDVTPVPEPESYAMLLAGLGVMGMIARRRNKVTA
ncbi:FxDxF family PEP-CTERM protein [Rhodoferax sp. TBRC 17660]|uniref:FxDxF family PEP-CTERM protein n=1 Tax=Rhodoferax potami TaxID=3068338 RepID=A0ABU3KPP1_9BURK|nr:FxDxF family PEP-CTERM protein [Rhodoferax sp. TBRC 17660]MDT7519665.1 FxDxF family PEP-CTERM protein [Rhodoferax sp. TBRC 17660]